MNGSFVQAEIHEKKFKNCSEMQTDFLICVVLVIWGELCSCRKLDVLHT